jgi:glycosyltransferase involved in cell wall biosynthesis
MVVQPDDPVALAEAVKTLWNEHGSTSSEAARARVVESFSIQRLVEQSSTLLGG